MAESETALPPKPTSELMPPSFYQYRPLQPSDAEDVNFRWGIPHHRKHWSWFSTLIFVLSVAGNLCILASWIKCHKHDCSLYPQLTDNPAQDALAYKTMVFDRDLIDEASIYEQEPSMAVDTAWRTLYEFSNSTLPGREQIPSFSESLEFVKQKGNRIRMLDVFHQLHCLDTIRQALYPDHYRHPIDMSHVVHCINSVRQSIMCMSDVSVVSWEWDQELDALIASGDSIHTCRDFDRIRQWASDNHFDHHLVLWPGELTDGSNYEIPEIVLQILGR